MSKTDYHFNGLDSWERKLAKEIEKTYPKEFEKMVVKVALQLSGRVKERTPVETGRLRNQWRVGKIQRRGKEYYIEVSNNMEYALPVEYGHRTRGGRGFVPGAHMMELSLSELREKLPGYLQTWLDQFLNRHEL